VEGGTAPDFSLRRCPGCGLLFVYPVPKVQEHFHNEMSVEPPSVSLLEFRETESKPYFDRVLREIKPHLAVGSRILDFGCGWGFFMKYMMARGFQAVGVETAPARRLHISRSLPGTGIVADLREIGDDTKFDLITCFEVIYYLPDPRRQLLDFREHLRPGGRLFLALSGNRGWVLSWVSRLKGSPVRLREGGWLTGAALNNRAYHAFTTSSVLALLGSLGFTDLRVLDIASPGPAPKVFRIPWLLWRLGVRAMKVLSFGVVDLSEKVHVLAARSSGPGDGEDSTGRDAAGAAGA
jgi:SAM-dependent methyltransferase